MDIKPLKILGVMSGTSGDGLDLALCRFSFLKGKWHYQVLQAETIPYQREIKEKLSDCREINARELIKLDHDYGRWIGSMCSEFFDRVNESADLIASHGHTVFHNPPGSYSLQIGDGHDIASLCGIPVIYDFRSMDIALGGQGAPLVPVGDDLLFGDFGACLNLGGISNISYRQGHKRIAFDICPVNMALNYLAGKLQKPYDLNGESGKAGKVIPGLFENLENLAFYKLPPPKSLGIEWFNTDFLPYLRVEAEVKDILRTIYEHISERISAVTKPLINQEILVTGGGAHNSFLVELISKKSPSSFILPDRNLIDFKEAIIFGFLGYLRYYGINNCLKSATGARKDSCGGVLVLH